MNVCKLVGQDGGACGWTAVQGEGYIGNRRLHTPATIRFGEMTEDDVFVTEKGAKDGVVIESTRKHEPRVSLRYFGPDDCPDAPEIGAYKNLKKK